MIKAYTDGACRGSNPGTCSCAFTVYDDGKLVNSCGFYLGEEHSNNYAEYQGLIRLLEWYAGSTVPMEIYSDSMLVVLQTQGVWKCEKEDLIPLRDKAQGLMLKGGHKIFHVRGHAGIEGNELADKLCNDVLDEVGKHKKLEKEVKTDYFPLFGGEVPIMSVSSYPPIYSTSAVFPPVTETSLKLGKERMEMYEKRIEEMAVLEAKKRIEEMEKGYTERLTAKSLKEKLSKFKIGKLFK